MKTKLLTLLTALLVVLNTYSQPNTTDYVSGLIDPIYIPDIGIFCNQVRVLGATGQYAEQTATSYCEQS